MSTKSDLHEIQRIFQNEIPIAGLMGAEVLEWDIHRVLLRAPFQKNKNHRNSVFGGSVHALLTLSCWAWVDRLLKDKKIPASVVIRSSSAKYKKPMLKEFYSECLPPPQDRIDDFIETLLRKKRARIEMKSRVLVDNIACAEFHGDFVAVIE